MQVPRGESVDVWVNFDPLATGSLKKRCPPWEIGTDAPFDLQIRLYESVELEALPKEGYQGLDGMEASHRSRLISSLRVIPPIAGAAVVFIALAYALSLLFRFETFIAIISGGSGVTAAALGSMLLSGGSLWLLGSVSTDGRIIGSKRSLDRPIHCYRLDRRGSFASGSGNIRKRNVIGARHAKQMRRLCRRRTGAITKVPVIAGNCFRRRANSGEIDR